MAHYVMEEMNIPHGDGRKRLFPRLIDSRCISHEALVEYVAKHCGYDAGAVEGVLASVVDCVGELMGFHGASVHINDLGTFTPTLALKREHEREESDPEQTHRNARSIEVGGVRFRPDKALIMNADKHCTLERSPYVPTIRPNACPYTLEQRLQKLTAYLKETPFISGKAYEELVQMPHTAAGKELRTLTEGANALLEIQGRGSHRVYTLRTTNPDENG